MFSYFKTNLCVVRSAKLKNSKLIKLVNHIELTIS